MRSPTSTRPHDESTENVGVVRRARRTLARLHAMGRVLVAITVIGTSWLVWDVANDNNVPSVGTRFERIDEYVADQMDGSRIPGVTVAVVEGGAVTYARGFGNDGKGHQVTADTPFWIGSNTKSITALAIMQLAESGAVDLDAPVQDYLPDFRLADEGESARITVRHLLNQTSGISRHDGLRAVLNADSGDSIADVVANMADLELNRPVGERFEYANLNTVVLGAVIEAVSGETWQDFVQVNIFDPLAMTNTYTDRTTAEANGLTATHRYVFGFPVEADAAHYPGLAPTGYVYASANDMARYLTMYLEKGTVDGNALLSESGIEEMLTPATNERTFPLQSQEFTARYGAGWFVGPFGTAHDARWHQGSLPNFTTWMVLLPDTDQAVIVMINAGNQFEVGGANAAWSRIPQGVVNLLRDAEPPSGTGTVRFFIVFDTIVALAVVAQAWTLARVLVHRRRPTRSPSAVRRTVPLAWELVVAPLVLIGYPGVAGGLGWGGAFAFVPDMSMAVAAVAGLAVLTGLARVARLVRTGPVAAVAIDADTAPDSVPDTAPDSAPDPAAPADVLDAVMGESDRHSHLERQYR